MRYFCLLLVSTLLFSCSDNAKMVTINHKDRFSIDLPEYMKATINEPHPDAEIQYEDVFRELYILVIEDNIRGFNEIIEDGELEEFYPKNIDGYARLVIDTLLSHLTYDKKPEMNSEIINRNKSKIVEIEGKYEGIDVFYIYGLIEGKYNYYQIGIWTLLERKNRFKDIMYSIIRSFKTLEKSES